MENLFHEGEDVFNDSHDRIGVALARASAKCIFIQFQLGNHCQIFRPNEKLQLLVTIHTL
jgi:hypothetical protein